MASLYGTILAALFVLAMPLLRRHVPARWRFALWILVLLRFVPLPLPESRLSVFNLLPQREGKAEVRDEVSPVAARKAAATLVVVEVPAIIAPPVRAESPSEPATPAKTIAPHAMPTAASASIQWPFIISALYLAGVAAVLLRFFVASLAL